MRGEISDMTKDEIKGVLGLVYGQTKEITDDIIGFKSNNKFGIYYIPKELKLEYESGGLIVRPTYAINTKNSERYYNRTFGEGTTIDLFMIGKQLVLEKETNIIEFSNVNHSIIACHSGSTYTLHSTLKDHSITIQDVSLFRKSSIDEPVLVSVSTNSSKEILAIDKNLNTGTIEDILKLSGIEYKPIKRGRLNTFEIVYKGEKIALGSNGQLY